MNILPTNNKCYKEILCRVRGKKVRDILDSALRRSFSCSRDMCEVAMSEKSRGKHRNKSPETAHVSSIGNPQTQHACRMKIRRQCSGQWKQTAGVKWRQTYRTSQAKVRVSDFLTIVTRSYRSWEKCSEIILFTLHKNHPALQLFAGLYCRSSRKKWDDLFIKRWWFRWAVGEWWPTTKSYLHNFKWLHFKCL